MSESCKCVHCVPIQSSWTDWWVVCRVLWPHIHPKNKNKNKIVEVLIVHVGAIRWNPSLNTVWRERELIGHVGQVPAGARRGGRVKGGGREKGSVCVEDEGVGALRLNPS